VFKISALQNKPQQILHFSKQVIDNENFIFDLICDSEDGDTILLRAPYTPSSTVQFNCVQKLHEKCTECSLAQHGFPTRFISFFFCQFCASSWACDYGG
jgi:hypothetical protein